MAGKFVADCTHDLWRITRETDLHYRRPPKRYEPGTLLTLQVSGVCPALTGEVTLLLEKFAGGGFAGQVYRTTLVAMEPAALGDTGLQLGNTYAVKIHVPPSGFARRFRDAIYWLGFQSPFSARVDGNAVRAGALWQKLIRRGVGCRFGDERRVADIHATFFDPVMRSHGEILEWVEGRGWRLEIDRDLFNRSKRSLAGSGGAKELLAKKEFMARFVALLHDIGAGELARQYEWWTAKSQPNVSKRTDGGPRPEAGLTALDFRAGLALLPFLPMSPIDFKLIIRGLRRGALVQFDRGDLDTLQRFCREHGGAFDDMAPALEELLTVDPKYRNALPDLTRHGWRLLREGGLRHEVKKGLISAWRRLELVDAPHGRILRESNVAFWLFWFSGALPILGRCSRRIWGNADYRRHLVACCFNPDYLRRALRVRQADCLIAWLRDGRVGREKIGFYLRHPLLFTLLRVFPGMLPLSAGMHRSLTDWHYARHAIKAAVVFPWRFYREAEFRVSWLNREIAAGVRQGMLNQRDKERIEGQMRNPLIQKYLQCLAIHFCTFPVTKLAMMAIALYAYFNFGSSWEESLAYAVAAMVIVGLLPISPGSLIRGFYILYRMVRERDFNNYWLAAAVSFWHYVGYLGVPLQMVKRFPALARLLASRWVTKVVRAVPVFGESGALLEYAAFDLFVNLPLTVRHRLQVQAGKTPAEVATVENRTDTEAL